MADRDKPSANQTPIPEEQVRLIQELAGKIQFGTITLVFQNGVLIQIDHSEKIRVSPEKKRS